MADSIIDTIIGLEWQHLLSEAILLDRDSILLMAALIKEAPAQLDDALTPSQVDSVAMQGHSFLSCDCHFL